MGEDLFWAIRGGGGGSFGIVLAWKLKLVTVPAIVTVFTVSKTVNSSEDEEKMTIQASFTSVFLGSIEELIPLMEEKFPELGLVKEDCLEMSWAESNLYSFLYVLRSPSETLLNRNQKSSISKTFFKAKSDFVKQPIPESAFEGLWSKFYEDEAKSASMLFV
ncbi:hypothetical protein Godav_007470, partial [Gossypium davidsonii]|nr:hypothetical protein [Gossypium davidsonii]